MLYLLWSGIVLLTFLIVFLLTQNISKHTRNIIIAGMVAIVIVYIPISNDKILIIVPLILLPFMSAPFHDFTSISILIYLTLSTIFFLWILLLMAYYHVKKEMDHKGFLFLLLVYIVSLIFLESSLFALGDEFGCIPETGKSGMYQYYVDAKPSFGEALKRAFTFCELEYYSRSVLTLNGPFPTGFISFIIAIIGLVISRYLFKRHIKFTSGKYFFGINIQRFIAIILLIVYVPLLLWLIYQFLFMLGYGIAMSLA